MAVKVSKSLQSNLDKTLTPKQIEEAERSERRKEFIAKKYSDAAKMEKSDGGSQPDIVFEQFQQQGRYTADPSWDKDPASVRRRAMLPVKEYVVQADGTFGVNIGGPGDAAYEAARQRLFCVNCRNRQPDSDKEWEGLMTRLEERIGPAPAPRCREDRCCYCGSELGFKGDTPDASLLAGMTPEQEAIMEQMFGEKIRGGE